MRAGDMKLAILVMMLGLGNSTAFADEDCSWITLDKPGANICDGEQYFYGQAKCKSGIYQNIFCHESKMTSGKTCADDPRDETKTCYKKLKRPATPGVARVCSWGKDGPELVPCGGRTYVYGTAKCDSGIYNEIFCLETEKDDGPKCTSSDEPETRDCYDSFIKHRDQGVEVKQTKKRWWGTGK
jgi:hypothetical protein